MNDNVIPIGSQQRSSIPPVPNELETIRALRKEGLSLKEIALRTGIPKSTIDHRLKQVESSQNDRPMGRRSSNVRAQPSPVPPVIQCEMQEVVQPEIVQNFNWTEENRPTESSKPLDAPTPEVVQPPSRPTTLRSIGWVQLGRLGLTLFPVGVLTPWLVATSAKVYSQEVGETWGWLLALGFESFFVVLATLAPSVAFRAGSPKEAVGSLPRLFKVVLWYVLLLGMGGFSYQAMTLPVVEGRAAALNSVAAATTTNAEITDLRKQQELLISTSSRYESQGWLGEARKLREDLRIVASRIENARQRATSTTPATVAAIEHRASVGKYLRLFALLINVFSIHLAVHSWKREGT